MNRLSYVQWFRSRSLILAAALLIAAAAAGPLFAGDGLLNTRGGGDSPFLLQRLQQLETAVRDGHFPVRWMADANYGYGYPFFNYYAPLSIYGAAVFRLVGFSFVNAIKLAQLAAFLAAAWGMFALAKRWFRDDWAALLASAAYTLAPFHLVNVYVRGDSLAEFWAMALYPLVLLAADNLTSQQKNEKAGENARNIGLLAFTYAALILSHNISALIFSPFLLLYLLLTGIHNSRFTAQIFLPSVGAIFLGLALAGWFFVPALAEKSLAQLGPVTEGYFHFSNHFLGTGERPLVQTDFLFNFDVEAAQAFAMGLVQAVTIIAGVAGLFFARRRIRLAPLLLISITLLTATFMLVPASRPLWQGLPLLNFTQFPWRFLSVQAFAGALAAAGLAQLPGKQWVVMGATAVLLLAGLGNLHPDFLPLADADVTPEWLAEYEWFTGNIGTTVSAEYLPVTVRPRPFTSRWLNEGERDAVIVLSGKVNSSRIIERKTAKQTWQITAVTPATLLFPTLFWPGWQAQVDGTVSEIRPSAGSGLIELDLPPGEHTILLRLRRTPVRLAAELLSVTALLILLWLVKPALPTPYRLGWILTGLVLITLVVRFWPERPLVGTTLNWDFAQMAALHHAPDGISFGKGANLSSYSLSDKTIQAGEALTLAVEWAVPPNEPVTAALVTPAISQPAIQPPPLPLISLTQPPASQQIFRLTLPENTPSGLYLPRLSMASQRAVTPSGQPRGDLFLSPVRVMAATETQAVAAHSLDARAVAVQLRGNSILDVYLEWRAKTPLSRNLNAHLELVDRTGNILSALDSQPGYGFLPTSGWQNGRWQADRLAMAVPTQPLDDRPFTLLASLIDVTNTRPVMIRRLGILVFSGNEIAFEPTRPEFDNPTDSGTGTAIWRKDSQNLIKLLGADIQQAETGINMTLYWQALADGTVEYTRFIHLVAEGVDAPPPAQADGMPGPYYPTGQWVAGQVIQDQIRLDLTAVPPGSYRLAVGFYQNLGDRFPRLTAVDEAGTLLADGRYFLPGTLSHP